VNDVLLPDPSKGLNRYFLREIVKLTLWGGVMACLLLTASAIKEGNLSWSRMVWCSGFIWGVLTMGWIAGPVGAQSTSLVWSKRTIILLGSAAATGLFYALKPSTLAAWVALGVFYSSLLVFDRSIGALLEDPGRQKRFTPLSLVSRCAFALMGGLLPVAADQVESHFAGEEFFAVVQGLLLSLVCFALMTVYSSVGRHGGTWRRVAPLGGGIRLDARVMSMVVAVGLAGAMGLTIRAYQASFFPDEAPSYEGISGTSPFICGKVEPAPGAPRGQEVHARAIELVAANALKEVPDLAFLALTTGDLQWAQAFREALLTEAKARRFTERANSVKSVQYEAALRVYYTILARQAFPELLSAPDLTIISEWFEAINRRALTVEWVDLLYALAFSKWPDGPYENQEIGAGLLSLLEETGLTSDEMAVTNRQYLRRNGAGWEGRWRNTDDAYIYQALWIINAFFQHYGDERASAAGSLADRNARLAFEWLLLQALPDGEALSYNHPARPALVGIYHLAARLLSDSRYIWLAERTSSALQRKGEHLSAIPGMEGTASLVGHSPTEGTCLFFGGSGLPNQLGPLAPDKIVFRDGWTSDATYLLSNLRFTGWHRYRATNSVVLLYWKGPIVVEKGRDREYSWLPVGRSQFRDKRIPRENLNSLLVPRSRIGHVVYSLTGMGSLWAQDPPYYARVECFETLASVDVSRTTMEGWRDWAHARTVYFFHEGLVLVVDSASSERNEGSAAVSWHLVGEGVRDGHSLWLRPDVRLAFPEGTWETVDIWTSHASGERAEWDLMYHSPKKGQLDLVTAFLIGEWSHAAFESRHIRDEATGRLLGQYTEVEGENTEIRVLHNESSARVQAGELSTDGRGLVTIRERERNSTDVCYVGGTEARVQLPKAPARLIGSRGDTLSAREDWSWSEGVLYLGIKSEASDCVMVVFQELKAN
jgi:hypothetical protein